MLVFLNTTAPGDHPGVKLKEGERMMFDVNILLISDEQVPVNNVKNISLTSSRMILVDDDGVQTVFPPGTINTMVMFNKNALAVGGMNNESME